jgi:Ankyrin repeats (3 copies)
MIQSAARIEPSFVIPHSSPAPNPNFANGNRKKVAEQLFPSLTSQPSPSSSDMEAVAARRYIEANTKDKNGLTALHRASATRNIDVVTQLINAGSDVSAKDYADGMTPMHCAAQNGLAGMIKALKEAGGDVHATSYCRWTPLFYASECGQVEAIKALIELGADVAARAHRGETVMWQH